MAYKDLKEFINLLESRGLLKRIKVEVDPVLEIAEINDRVVKAGGPALLFENPNVKGKVLTIDIKINKKLSHMSRPILTPVFLYDCSILHTRLIASS